MHYFVIVNIYYLRDIMTYCVQLEVLKFGILFYFDYTRIKPCNTYLDSHKNTQQFLDLTCVFNLKLNC